MVLLLLKTVVCRRAAGVNQLATPKCWRPHRGTNRS